MKDFQLGFWGSKSRTSKLGPWINVFNNWKEMQDRYYKEAREEGWYYSERPSVGFLNAAVWRTGGVGMEEFEQTKTGSKRENFTGRADWFGILEGNKYWIEAKYAWLSLTKSARNAEKIKRVAAELKEDVLTIPPSANETRCGIIFMTFFYPISKMTDFNEKLQGRLEDTYPDIRKQFPSGLRVDYCYPIDKLYLPKGRRYVFPCTSVFLGLLR